MTGCWSRLLHFSKVHNTLWLQASGDCDRGRASTGAPDVLRGLEIPLLDQIPDLFLRQQRHVFRVLSRSVYDPPDLPAQKHTLPCRLCTDSGKDLPTIGSLPQTWGRGSHALGSLPQTWGKDFRALGFLPQTCGKDFHVCEFFPQVCGKNFQALGFFPQTWKTVPPTWKKIPPACGRNPRGLHFFRIERRPVRPRIRLPRSADAGRGARVGRNPGIAKLPFFTIQRSWQLPAETQNPLVLSSEAYRRTVAASQT